MRLPAMRLPERKYLIGAAVLALLAAGAAEAATAKLHTMNVKAPDGSVVEIHYAGDVAPQVQFVPAMQMDPAAYEQAAMDDPFVQMDRVSAMMDAQMHMMMQRAAVMQQQAAQMQQHMVAASANGQASVGSGAPGFTVVGDMPRGSHFSYVSSTTDANGCTRTVSYSSEGQQQGQGGKPQLTKVSSDSCEAAGSGAAAKAVPVKAEAPVQQDGPTPGQKV
ncbi:hypothetical protein [Novosphingobium sp. 9]|uniref:hypothetical protein n=1 Tax=Novosphingobium sp. 9 TaxID=2025349 RepID=UPI0021B5B0CC|nr:hypothetical protein [Novosphingobium sp. 9]